MKDQLQSTVHSTKNDTMKMIALQISKDIQNQHAMLQGSEGISFIVKQKTVLQVSQKKRHRGWLCAQHTQRINGLMEFSYIILRYLWFTHI